jgi:hypothetical protein
MASAIIGRFVCMCGFRSAHVKQSEKCLFHFCPSCGMNGPHARTEAQKEIMRKGMRPEEVPTPTPTPTPSGEKPASAPAQAVLPTPTGTQPTDTVAVEAATTTAPKRRGLFS